MKKSYLVGAVLTTVGMFYGASLMAHGAADAPEKRVPMQYFKNAQKMKIKSMDVEGTNAYLEDIVAIPMVTTKPRSSLKAKCT